MVKTKQTISTHKPLNLNCSLTEKILMCGSFNVGHVSQDAVKRYINEQEGKDVFDYNIFNDPTGQTKIGDFSC